MPFLAPVAEAPAVVEAEALITNVRVVVQCRSGSTGDRLVLQEQDEVADILGIADADELMANVAEAGRTIASACSEAWRRARPSFVREQRPGPIGDVPLGKGIVLRAGEIAIEHSADPAKDQALALRVALAAAERQTLIERDTMDRLANETTRPDVPFDDDLRAAFVGLLATGDALIPVVEALDQRHIFERYIPEWLLVRNRPQRNAYHRYTVDRHLLEAVARAGEHVGDVARPDLLLLVGAPPRHRQGWPRRSLRGRRGDRASGHGATRLPGKRRRDRDRPRLDAPRPPRLRHAARPRRPLDRDRGRKGRKGPRAPLTPRGVDLRGRPGDRLRGVGTVEGRPRAPPRRKGRCRALWSPDRAERANRADRSSRPSSSAAGKLAVRATGKHVTVVAPDRPGLLAAVAGVLALNGCNVRRAMLNSADGDMAVDVFIVEPTFDRLPDWEKVERDLQAALDGTLPLVERLAEQDRTYARGRRPASARPAVRQVTIDNATSERASIIEVRTPDRVGLLQRIAATLVASDLDVVSALADTLGHEVVDTFYVRETNGEKLSDPTRIHEVRERLEQAIGRGD